MIIMMTALFLWNTAFASVNVSKRRYGWATGYALSAVWSALIATVEYYRMVG